MKYIREVSLKNFQSHKNTVLKFDNKLNIIVGPSDSGKTSILRAIKWVLYNEPLGDYFIREGESSCSVSLELNNGIRVERYRDKSKNQYRLYREGEEEIYEGFGSGVPLEISQALGIDKLELDQKESRTINLAEQLEGPFLISEKPSVKASSIGRLVGANIIDDALKESLRDNRNLNIQSNNILETNQALEEELKLYDHLEAREKNLKSLELISEKIGQLEDRKKQVEGLARSYKSLLEDKLESEKLLARLVLLEEVEAKLEKIQLKLYKFSSLKGLGIKILDNEKNLKKERKVLDKTKDLVGLEEDLERLNQLYKQSASLGRISSSYRLIREQKQELASRLLGLEKIQDLDLGLVETSLLRQETLSRLSAHYKTNQASLAKGRDYLDRLKDLDRLGQELELIDEKRLLRDNLLKSQENLEKSRQAILKGQEFLREKNLLIVDILGQYKRQLEEAKTCPLCLSRLDSQHIDQVMEKFMEENSDEL